MKTRFTTFAIALAIIALAGCKTSNKEAMVKVTYYIKNCTPSLIYVRTTYYDPTPVPAAQEVQFTANFGDSVKYTVYNAAMQQINQDDFRIRGTGDDLNWDGKDLDRGRGCD